MSDSLLLPPRHILERLICFSCQEYLSCDPVKILPNNSVICGRCKNVQMRNVNTIRSVAFEKLASYFGFPCKHPKCNMVLSRTMLQSHETKCPMQPGCCLCFRSCRYTHQTSIYSNELVLADDATMELLICSYCHGYLSSSPIFLRPDGQNVCYRCGPDLQTPPILRNVPLEAILEVFLLKCSYRMSGCEQRSLFGLEMIKHETMCKFNINQQSSHSQEMVHQHHQPLSSNIKQHGVIGTISGHIYATISPNHFLAKAFNEANGNNKEEVKKGETEDIEMDSMKVEVGVDDDDNDEENDNNEDQSQIQSQNQIQSQSQSHSQSIDGELIENSTRKISLENHHFDVYSPNSETDAPHNHRVPGIERNPSFLLYEKVVKEMRQKLRKPAIPLDVQSD